MGNATTWFGLLLLAGCAGTEDTDGLGGTGPADVHGSISEEEAEARGLEIGQAADTLDQTAEFLEVDAARPTMISVDIIDAVGTEGADARTLAMEPFILAFNRAAAATSGLEPPTLVVGDSYRYRGREDILEVVTAQLTAGRLNVVLLSTRTMTRLAGPHTCGARVTTIRNAVFYDPAATGCQTMSLAHEVGHWLGLSHTFGTTNELRGATRCVDMDNIDDTPVHLGTGLSYYCGDALPDSCPSQPGVDPFNNIMSYGCLVEFTPGQIAAMGATWARVWRARGFR